MELHHQPTRHGNAELTRVNENLELDLGWPLSSTLADSNYHSGVARSSSEQAWRTERFTGFLASASSR